jgi:pyridoxamine 5'-phosphate oxidase-like protein
MATWDEFGRQAPRISQIFSRRHAATGGLCMLGTLRSDGYPRISPMEPRIFEEHMWIGGMPNTFKLRDLGRDPRFTLHTATVDTQVSDGDAKVWGVVRDVQDSELQGRYAEWMYAETGIDVRGQRFHHLYAADLRGAASVEVSSGHLDITIWKPGEPERVVRKH